MAQIGKSCSADNPQGKRRKTQEGRTLAPRHFRKIGRHFMDEVTDAEIAKVYFGIDGFDTLESRNAKQIQVAKGQITKLDKQLADDPDNRELAAKREIQEAKINSLSNEIAYVTRKCSAFRAS